jgi:hypothetical protein
MPYRSSYSYYEFKIGESSRDPRLQGQMSLEEVVLKRYAPKK